MRGGTFGTLTAVSDRSQLPYGGAGDSRAGGRSLADRFRRHANSLVEAGRSPLYVQLMGAAADDIDRGGPVAQLFAGIPTPPGSVPQLRLMGALHYLVLSGQAPELAAFYPSAGGDLAPDGVWPAAQAAMHENFGQVKARLHRTVQTNEPGRSAVLFAGLLWLTDRHRRPIRLLEIGASAGLNLIADRYGYVAGGVQLADPDSPLQFVEPWTAPPPFDLEAAAARLHISARAGCDLAPLDPMRHDDQLTLLSYIWPDELDRVQRLRAALSVAARDPVPVAPQGASAWLRDALRARRDGELTVVWHSIMRQYVEPEEWAAIEDAIEQQPGVVRLSMEPTLDEHMGRPRLALHDHRHVAETVLAVAGDHGLPIRWASAYSPTA